MHVILGSDAIHRPLTGIGRYALELARHLRQATEVEQLEFFSFGRWAQWPELLTAESAQASTPTTVAQRRTLRSVMASNAWAVNAYQALTPALYAWRLRHKADALFHSPNYFLPPHPGLKVATIHDLSHVWYPQFHPQTRVDFLNKAFPQTLRRADFLITDAESVRQEVISHFGWPADKIAAVPLGADAAYHPRTADELQTTLHGLGLDYEGYALYVGTVEPRKNLNLLLQAYEALPQSERLRWPLVIAGSRGWNSDDLHAQMTRAAEQGWLHYLGYVSQAQLPLLYAGARLFVYPSLYEGFGLPPLEAMASGVPVVCSRVSSLPEVVGQVALTVEPRDAEALKQALARGLTDEVWRSYAKKAGRIQAQKFSWQTCSDQTLRIYAECLSRINR